MMNKKFVLIVAGGLFLTANLLLTSGCFKKKPPQVFFDDSTPVVADSSSGSDAKTAPKIQDYQADLQAILRPYWEVGDSAGVKDKLLALTTPAEFLNLHLDLAIAFELIEQGQSNNDQAKIDEGQAKLGQLKQRYAWIANY